MNGFAPPMPVAQGAEMRWKIATANDGRKYYFDPSTRETRWSKPEELMEPNERATVGTSWDILDHNGRSYWAHKETKQTTWEMPDEVRANMDRIQNNAPPLRPPP